MRQLIDLTNSLRIKSELLWANFRGSSTPNPIVVFESDDWGSIRLRDRQAFERMERAGLNLASSAYNSLDCLEKSEDLESLLGVISKHRDRFGGHPIFTLNTVVCNPDFERIAATNFQEYHSENLFASYHRYYDQDLTLMWQQGINSQMIFPQFHAREHLNVNLWMLDLQRNVETTRFAFHNHFFGLRTKTSSPIQKHYVSAYSPESPEEFFDLQLRVADGLQIFQDLFGYKSTSFVGCNYVWPLALEPFLKDAGVRHFQTRLKRFSPDPQNSGKRTVIRHFTGQINAQTQTYGVRNVVFEPYANSSRNWVDSALKQIESAFFFRTPAVICTHRINYCSNIRPELRETSLKLLSQLIQDILRRWPNVQFMSSAQLATALLSPNDETTPKELK
jgi:hypothetical protein